MKINYYIRSVVIFLCLIVVHIYYLNAQNIQSIITKTKGNPEWQISNIQFADTIGDGVEIAIDDATTYQEFKGLGVSFDRSSMNNFIGMNDTERNKALRALFDQDQDDGIKLDWLRYPLGTSDFTNTEWYTYNDLSSGDTNPDLSDFSIQIDIDYGFINLVKEVIAINPNIKILGSVWSPPAWMKTNNKLTNGGDLQTQYQAVYATYLRKIIQAFAVEGINIDAITIQNEPEVSQVYPSCKMSIANIIAVQKHLKTEFDTHNITTQIFAGDTQWSKKDDYVLPQTDSAIANNNNYLAGAAWHWYGGGPSAMTSYYNAYPDKLNMMSEVQLDKNHCSYNNFFRIAQYFHNYCHVVIDWITFIDDEGETINPGNPFKPIGGGKVITADHNNLSDWKLDRLYYHYGMISRWVEEGSVRIKTPLKKNNLYVVGFKNDDGTIVVTLANDNCKTLASKYTITWQGKSFSFDIPTDPFIATFVWHGNTQLAPVGLISQSSDDAEQNSDNSVSLISGDLDLGEKPINGVRFNNIDIPQGATITNAYVQFTADKSGQTASANYSIKGEDVDNAATFSSSSENLSSRTLTSASVNWNNIPAWNTSGESADAQKTPDLTSIIQEIVDRSGWSIGNSLVIFITGTSGKRSAITYDNDSQKVAKLFVEYELAKTYQVSQSTDDAEQKSNNSVDISSGDLDLGDKPISGLKFNNINLTQGASISKAYIQFTADKDSQAATASYTIKGEDVDNANTFSSSNSNISGRTYTTASVDWNNIHAWNTAGESADAQKTPDISSIIQEIVDRNGWQSGNSLVLLISGTSGKRSAVSYNGNPAQAPKLIVEVSTNQRRIKQSEQNEISELIIPVENVIFYPNPATKVINLIFEKDDDNEVIIMGINGKKIKKIDGLKAKASIDLQGINPGLYLIKINHRIEKLVVK